MTSGTVGWPWCVFSEWLCVLNVVILTGIMCLHYCASCIRYAPQWLVDHLYVCACACVGVCVCVEYTIYSISFVFDCSCVVIFIDVFIAQWSVTARINIIIPWQKSRVSTEYHVCYEVPFPWLLYTVDLVWPPVLIQCLTYCHNVISHVLFIRFQSPMLSYV